MAWRKHFLQQTIWCKICWMFLLRYRRKNNIMLISFSFVLSVVWIQEVLVVRYLHCLHRKLKKIWVSPSKQLSYLLFESTLQLRPRCSSLLNPNHILFILFSSPQSPEDTTINLSPDSPLAAKGPPPPSARKQPSVWRGFVMMNKVSRFVCTAYAVSGSCSKMMEILPDTIQVCGRIPPNQVWDYLSLLKEGRNSHKVCTTPFC